ncbi:MAG: ABC transporter substrate-binding protein [Candidatus Poribacteria bacterium]|nr:ABC transporter substrate-binding protein [Candidatus Poribacteria bacterium]
MKRLQIPLLSYHNRILFLRLSISALVLIGLLTSSSDAKLKIAYSDWPGWVAWEIGIQKDWFKKVGVDVEFQWLEYVPSMDAFAAGQVDACCMTNVDALVTGATGKKGVGIIINDYSDGNDMVVAVPGITKVSQLKGKKVGVETGFVGHLLLLQALEENGLTESDVELINYPTDQTAQALESGDVAAIVAWQPNSGQALKVVPGSKPVFTSADAKGLIYDLLYVTPESLGKNRNDWLAIVKVWYKIVDYMKDPKNEVEMLEILSARVQISMEEYEKIFQGTYILTLDEAKKFFKQGEGFSSVYGSSQIGDNFNVKYGVYAKAEFSGKYLDPSLTNSLK